MDILFGKLIMKILVVQHPAIFGSCELQDHAEVFNVVRHIRMSKSENGCIEMNTF